MGASHANHRVFWRHLARACHGESVDIPGGLLVRTGIPESAYNQLHLDADAAHGLPRRVYAEQDSPGGGHVRRAVRRPGGAVVSRAEPPGRSGWRLGDRGLELSFASGLAELRAFVDCAGAAYRFNSALLTPLVHQRALDDPALRLHLGRLGGQVVAIGVSVRHEDTVGIYFVGVRRQHRRHGFGRLLTGQALRAVPEARVAVLQATSAGLSLYQNMGFAVVAEYRLWDLPSGSG